MTCVPDGSSSLHRPVQQNDLAVASAIQVQPAIWSCEIGQLLVNTIASHKANKVETISRYKHKTMLYDPQSCKEHRLLALLTVMAKTTAMVLAGENKTCRSV